MQMQFSCIKGTTPFMFFMDLSFQFESFSGQGSEALLRMSGLRQIT